MSTRAGALLCLAACGRLSFDRTGDAGSSAFDSAPDSPVDALGLWSAPQVIAGLDTSSSEEDCSLSADGNELFFSLDVTDQDVYRTFRADRISPWQAPVVVPVAAVQSSVYDATPRLSSDGLSLSFASNRNPTTGGFDLWRTTRSGPGQPFGTAVSATLYNSARDDKWFTACDTGYYVMVRIDTSGEDLYAGTQGQPPTLIAELSRPGFDSSPFLTPDCLALYFSSDVSANGTDIYISRRATTTSPWGTPEPFTEVNLPGANDEDPALSADGRVFVFSSDRNGGQDIYIIQR